jgi:hypothetical protein
LMMMMMSCVCFFLFFLHTRLHWNEYK